MKFYRFFILSVMMVLVSNFANIAQADNYSNTIKVFKKSKVVQPFFKNAYGYAVFPTIGKGGVGIGGPSAKGRYIGEVW